MKLHTSELALLTQLALIRDSWENTAANALSTAPAALVWSEVPSAWAELSSALNTPAHQEAFRAAVREILSGQVHSILVALDGGSSLAETTSISIEDGDGHVFKTHLHEFWPQVGGLLEG